MHLNRGISYNELGFSWDKKLWTWTKQLPLNWPFYICRLPSFLVPSHGGDLSHSSQRASQPGGVPGSWSSSRTPNSGCAPSWSPFSCWSSPSPPLTCWSARWQRWWRRCWRPWWWPQWSWLLPCQSAWLAVYHRSPSNLRGQKLPGPQSQLCWPDSDQTQTQQLLMRPWPTSRRTKRRSSCNLSWRWSGRCCKSRYGPQVGSSSTCFSCWLGHDCGQNAKRPRSEADRQRTEVTSPVQPAVCQLAACLATAQALLSLEQFFSTLSPQYYKNITLSHHQIFKIIFKFSDGN